ncbi:MAG: helix-turn-helix domain-containing protein [Bacteroidales bacterium]|nr:helix-turn-helix domain-containing protein [Bacteroidales bacterium]
MSTVLSEITGLSQRDCFYIVERHKKVFDYPLHQHREFELNFVQNGQGVRRIVGDNVEEIGTLDLVLIAGENLEHVWEQGNCHAEDIREITIQFSSELFSNDLLNKNQFASIQKMLEKAAHGVSFPFEVIMKVYHRLDTLATEPDSFQQFINCLQLLYELSESDYKILASSSFAHAPRDRESRRILKVKEYINAHYAETLTLEMMADLVSMSPSSFSRFFKQHTNRTFSTYLIDIRLGHAARALVDTSQNISEICYACGFNNLSNFNRIFKAKRGVSPRDFRQIYKKKKVIV